MATDHTAQATSTAPQAESKQPASESPQSETARPGSARGYPRDYAEWEEEESEWEAEVARHSRLHLEDRQLAQVLGWVSIGLGLVELAAPRALGRAIGVGHHPIVLRLLGLREITTGIGLLSERALGDWAWARVAGDAMDLTLLGAASRSSDAETGKIALTTTAVLGVTAFDTYAARRLTASQSAEAPQIAVTEAVTINETPEVVYEFWRNLENLPLFMHHLESVSATSERISHWVATAPAGTSVEWDSELIEDEPGRRLGWRTLPDSEVTHEGMVSFEPAPGGRGTVVRVDMLYRPPAGKVGARIARLFGEEPSVQVKEDLRRLKQLLETGEVATTLGQPSGRRSLLGRIMLGRRLQ
ncbi:MAG TPA: SRPBCC family protein [Steroidobacteraceae bacterium]